MNLKEKVFSSLVWTTSGELIKKIIQFTIAVALARLLTPEDFGVIAMALVINSISLNIIDGGFSHSIVQVKKIKPEALFSIMLINILISILVAFTIYILRFKISNFFNVEILSEIIPIFSVSCVLSGIGAVPGALLTREMRFRELTLLNILASIISGSIAIFLAFNNFGPWALAIQSLLFTLVLNVGYWKTFNHKFDVKFNFKEIKEYSIFGKYILFTSLLDSILGRIYPIIIGKIYDIKQVGLFSRAESTQGYPSALLTFIINSISFPLFCKIEEKKALKNIFFRVLEMAYYISIPLVAFISILSYPLVTIIYGNKWADVSGYLQILVFIIIFRLPTLVNFSLIKSLGNSKSVFKIEVIQKIISIFALIFTFKIGIKALIFGQVVTTFLTFITSCYFVFKITNINLRDQFSNAYKPIFAVSFLSFFIIIYLNTFSIDDVLDLFLISLFSSLIYFIISNLLKIKSQKYFKEQILNKIK